MCHVVTAGLEKEVVISVLGRMWWGLFVSRRLFRGERGKFCALERVRGRGVVTNGRDIAGLTGGRRGGGTLSTTVTGLRGSFNGNTIVQLKRSKTRMTMRAIPAKYLDLSLTLKLNNIPGKHIVRICNPRSDNGAAITLRVVSRIRGEKKVTKFVSTRRTLSPMCTGGVKMSVSRLCVSRPSDKSRTLRVTRAVMHSKTVSVVIVSSMTTLIPGRRVRKSVKSDRINLRTELVSRTLEGLAPIVDGSGYVIVFVGRLHRGIKMVFKGPRAAAKKHTLGFCTSIHVSIEEVRALGRDKRVMKGHAEVHVIGGGVTPPFGRTRFSVVFKGNVSHTKSVLSLTAGVSLIGGDNT